MRNLKVLALLAFTTVMPYSVQADDHAGMSPVIEVPAGGYKIDPSHASLIFRVNHLGVSHYTARFTKVDAELQFDPAKPEKASVVATIDPRSIQTDFPDSKLDFNAELYGEKFLDAGKFPQITFRSTSVKLTGKHTAKVTGDLILHGVTQKVVLDTTFNGGYKQIPMDPSKSSRIGFSAHGSLKRSLFGVSYGIPQPGTAMGVGDDVDFVIEAEFTRPADTADKK